METTQINNIIIGSLVILFMFIMQACKVKSNELQEETSYQIKHNYLPIATGQTNTYDEDGNLLHNINTNDSLYGQDAHYLKGEKMSYTNNHNGTISDNNTGLMWQEIPSSEGFDWQAAKDYCENLTLGGFDDWRMPTAKELYSISDFSEGWPYLDTTYFSLVNNTFVDKSEQYWTNNPYIGHTEEGQYSAAFGVNHATGHIKAYAGESHQGREKPPHPSNNKNQEVENKNENRPPPPPNGNQGMGNPMLKHVRAVRGPVYGENDFIDNGDETITDKATGLMWSKNDSKQGFDWKNALYYAEHAQLAGYSDWRLPNVKELQGIVDYNYAPGAKDSSYNRAAINPLFNTSIITNENDEMDYPYYWTSTSARFQKGKPYYYAWYVAFGRAVNNEGLDFHGAGAVRFDTKHENGPASEGGERYYNYVRLVRNID